MPELVLPFSYRGAAGKVTVALARNTHPERLGCRAGALELPACTATVTFGALGYRAMFGWVQLVKSTDNRSAGEAFEMDPFSLFADAASPYCFFGHLPTLFDGPSRPGRDDLDWLAHSFLATTPFDGRRRVLALVGFSWGFRFRQGRVALVEPNTLSPADWRVHLPVLEAAHPGWSFAPDAWAA